MKKIASVFTSALLAASAFASAYPVNAVNFATEQNTDKLTAGDVNYDSNVDAIDASLVLEYYLIRQTSTDPDISFFTEEQCEIADMNQDGRIDPRDASLMLNYYAYRMTGGTLCVDDWLSGKDDATAAAPDFSGTADGDFTAEKIADSAVKPTLSASKITLSESEARGQTVTISIEVSGVGRQWCSSGIHLFYDERLTPDMDDVSWGSAIDRFYNYMVKAGSNCIFFTTSGYGDDGEDGTIISYKFMLPDDAAAGDIFDLDLRYVAGDLFTNHANDETGKLMQAYLFTQGMEDGYIQILPDVLCGDADESGVIEIADAVKVMCYVTDKESTLITEQGILNGDVYQTGDGLSVQDALAIQKYLAQIITKLPES